MTRSQIIFVSSLLHIEYSLTITDYISSLTDLLNTGIHLRLFVLSNYIDFVTELENAYPDNLKITALNDVSELTSYKTSSRINYTLPHNRNKNKDTESYILQMYSNMDFIQQVIKSINDNEYTHICWLNSNITLLFNDKQRTLEYIKILSKRTINLDGIAIPGCWEYKRSYNTMECIAENVCWRFCGGFFIGNCKSVLHLCELYINCFPKFIEKYNKLAWEMNFWAWLEIEQDWNPLWYKAHHNDSIITALPAQYFSTNISMFSGVSLKSYDYPKLSLYNPSSASYLFHENKHWLITRYVNYVLGPKCSYSIRDPMRIIKNKHFLSQLDPTTMTPMYYTELDDSRLGLEQFNDKISNGLEDIRMYVFNGTTRFIATSCGYSPYKYNCMISGDLDLHQCKLANGEILHNLDISTTNCEKNWIPIQISLNSEERFIYKWNPFQILYGTTRSLKQSIGSPLFNKMRGSSTFVETERGMVGVLHFCEYSLDAYYYYHVLVLLDKNTFVPIQYSNSFYFNNIGIEYCIGFSIIKNAYYFWISQMDRDPLLLIVDSENIPLCFDVKLE